VDTPEDLAFMRRVLAQVAMSDGTPASMLAIMVAAERLNYSDSMAAVSKEQTR
jgi:hypothetical protein